MNSHAQFTDSSGATETVFDITPDVVDALVHALRNARNIEPPRHAEDFEALLAVIAQATRVIAHLEGLRDLAIVKADASHTHADRKALAVAAGWPPSRLYRVLERHGRPRDRSASA